MGIKKIKKLFKKNNPLTFRLTKENKIYLKGRRLINEHGRIAPEGLGKMSKYLNKLIMDERQKNIDSEVSITRSILLFEIYLRQEERDKLQEELNSLAAEFQKLSKKKGGKNAKKKKAI
tara:strand:+ start:586 stop:942 length:357 start_codon:yes stop_codon:yes gene_type:complete